MSAFDSAWSLLKYRDYEPTRTMQDEDESRRRRGYDAETIVPRAAELFLGTIITFLESGQEDYVARELNEQGFFEVDPELIEQGRVMAMDKVAAALY